MGHHQSSIVTIQGQEIKNKKCIIMVTPPSYQITKVMAKFPQDFNYEYISIGQMIRDEINKKTNYSTIIMQNLQKDKKINENILDILLKNATLLRNFIIKFAPVDQEQIAIWKKFIGKADLQMVVIVRSEADQNLSKRPSYRQKYKQYQKDVQTLKNLVNKGLIIEFDKDQNPFDKISKKMQEKPK